MAERAVLVDAQARESIESIYRWIAQRSTDGAHRWYSNILVALDHLAKEADRYAEAPESHRFEETIRNLSFRMRSGRTYRVLFTIRGNEVHALFVRAPGQDLASP